jgi:S-adenosyl methyltransferase
VTPDFSDVARIEASPSLCAGDSTASSAGSTCGGDFYTVMTPSQVAARPRAAEREADHTRHPSRRLDMPTTPRPPFDTSRAHPARVYDYLLGGKDNFERDRETAEALPPTARAHAVQNRSFMRRAVHWLAQQGCDQFLDIGTGIPTEPNLHQVAQEVQPTAKIVYTDIDPIVLRHAEAWLESTPEGESQYVEADVRDPEAVLEHARGFLDFARPIALSLIGILHFLPDREDPYGIVRHLVDGLPSGSHLVMTQGASDLRPSDRRAVRDAYGKGGIELSLRTRSEFAGFFEGLELLDPGIVTAPEWVMDGPAFTMPDIALYAAVARVP